MAAETIEQRLAALELQVAELAAKQEAGNAARGDWRSAVGWAKDDPGYDEMAGLGAEYRKSLREDDEDAGT